MAIDYARAAAEQARKLQEHAEGVDAEVIITAHPPKRRGRPPGSGSRGPQARDDHGRPPGYAIAQSMLDPPAAIERGATPSESSSDKGIPVSGEPRPEEPKACSCPQTAVIDGVPMFDCHSANTAAPPPPGFYCMAVGPGTATAAEKAEHMVDQEMHHSDAQIIAWRRLAGKFGGFTEKERALVDDTLAEVKGWWSAMPGSRTDSEARAKVVTIVERVIERVFDQ